MDEPLYREWMVAKKGAVERPYMDAMLTGVSDEEGVPPETWQREQAPLEERLKEAVEKLKETGGVIFCKHMAKHDCVYDFRNELTADNVFHKHVLLIRDPVAVLSSWKQSGDVHGHTPTIDEVGILPMMSIYSKVVENNSAFILNSDELVADPSETLSSLCTELGIPYEVSMLTWEAGPHECDGPWAKWWYHQVHKSAGWQPRAYMSPLSKYQTLDPSLLSALRASLPAYDFLNRLSHSYQTRGPAPTEIYEDPRNQHVLVWIGAPGRGRLVPRELACISPWDSSVQGGGTCFQRGSWLSWHLSMNDLLLNS
jgi:hypothetical protein